MTSAFPLALRLIAGGIAFPRRKFRLITFAVAMCSTCCAKSRCAGVLLKSYFSSGIALARRTSVCFISRQSFSSSRFSVSDCAYDDGAEPSSARPPMMTAARMDTVSPRLSLLIPRRIDFTGRRMPLRAVALFLERGAQQKRLIQIFRVFDHARHGDPLIDIRFVVAIEVLGEFGVLAVRNAVLSKVAGLHVRGDDLQVAPGKSSPAAAAKSQSCSLRLLVPFSSGVTLPRALARLR